MGSPLWLHAGQMSARHGRGELSSCRAPRAQKTIPIPMERPDSAEDRHRTIAYRKTPATTAFAQKELGVEGLRICLMVGKDVGVEEQKRCESGRCRSGRFRFQPTRAARPARPMGVPAVRHWFLRYRAWPPRARVCWRELIGKSLNLSAKKSGNGRRRRRRASIVQFVLAIVQISEK